MADKNQREYNTVVLAGLLHDIGKFFQKGGRNYFEDKTYKKIFFNKTGPHPLISWNFVKHISNIFKSCNMIDYELLLELVKRHHDFIDVSKKYNAKDFIVDGAEESYKALAQIVSTADTLSSKERDKGREYGDYRTEALANIFSSISLDDKCTLDRKYNRISVLEPDNCIPAEFYKNSYKENSRVMEYMSKEFEKIKDKFTGEKDFNTIYTLISTLIVKYTWGVPSSVRDTIRDVSLLDHLKTTSAIAACLYKYHQNKNDFDIKSIKNDNIEKFKMIAGSFSGIQSYIFELPSGGEGGIAKKLRARSFMVNILLEVISHYICHAFGLPLNNIVLSTGGKFYILLPNIESVNQKLQEILKELETLLYSNFHGEISVNIAEINFKGSDCGNFDKIMHRLNMNLNQAKTKQFYRVLTHIDTGDSHLTC